jgi:cytochrome c biogenesis protein CcmG/thiol:disulfide interchange protein DsbE
MSAKVWRLLIIMAVFGGAAWIWLSKAPPGGTTNGTIPAPQVGFQAPDFELVGPNGETYRLSDLRGHPVLINFWASWCTPCKAEMPAIDRIYRQYQQQGFLVLAVNSTIQDDQSAAQTFADQLGLSFPTLFDRDGKATRAYKVRALPTSFFVNSSGTIRENVVGGPMSEALLNVRVQQLMGDMP